MMFEEVYNAINKGIPNYLSIELDKDILLRECALDKSNFTSILVRIREEYQNNIYNLCGCAKAQYYFFDNFRLITSYKNSETSIHISPIPFINKLKKLLGVDNDSIDFNDEELKRLLLEKLDLLKTVTTPEELKDLFPLIYEDYKLSCRAYKVVKSSDGDKYNYLRRQYNMYGFDTRFDVFIKHQIRNYRNFIIRRQFVEGYCNRNSIDLINFKDLDKNKFELYLAYLYLEKANNSKDLYEIQECIKYLACYIREFKVNNENDVCINVYGKVITFKNIFYNYIILFRRHKDLIPLDSDREFFKGYHINHVKNHINKYYGNSVNWFIVPNGDGNDFNINEREDVINYLNRQYNYLSKDERDKIISKRYEVYDRKVKFYESSNYMFKLMGLNDFNGYVAYVYDNGSVILDKLFYDYTSGTPAYDEAIYIMDISYFDKLSKFNKQELIKDSNVTRRFHSGDWESKLIEQISKSDNSDNKNALNEFKLKHKIKSN